MDKYENLGMIGEGSYGMVMKCRHKETKQLVAIKKFLETEDDKMVKKIALREVRMLKQVRHENLVNLIEVFRRKKRLYLVFEFVDHTALDDLERYPSGAEENFVKKIMFQLLKGVEFCHTKNIIHRDVKPENILISKRGVVKLCDFGFARTIAPPGEAYTDYVATRWYRAPELLVGDTSYGRAVDIWAIGCLFSEMLTGEPLFPGESDIDQLYLITKCFGNLIARHREIFTRNPLFLGMRLPDARELEPMERRYPHLSPAVMDIVKWSLRLEPNDRPTCSQLVRHELFTKQNWADKFSSDLRTKIEHEFGENPLIASLGVVIHGSVHDAKNRASNEQTSSNNQLLLAPKRHIHVGHGVDHGTGGGGGLTGGGGGAEALASDMDAAAAAKKEKKKKKTKAKELLQHRDKAQPEKIRTSKKPHSPLHPHPTSTIKLQDLPVPTVSQHSLTGSRAHRDAPSPRHAMPQAHMDPLSPRGMLSTGADVMTHVIAPTPGPRTTDLAPSQPFQFGFQTHPPKSPHHHHHPHHQHASSHIPTISLKNHAHGHTHTHTHPQNKLAHSPSNTLLKQTPKSYASPPTSSILEGPAHKHYLTGGVGNGSTSSLTNQQQGYSRSEYPSDISLISGGSRYRPNKLSPMLPEKLLGSITSPAAHHVLTSPLGSPGATARLFPGAAGGGGGGSYKKQYSKNKDTILLPHLKDAELHHVKAVSQAPMAATQSSTGLAVGSVGNRGLLLGPHITSIESFRGAPGMRPPPTPPTLAQQSSHQVIR